MFGVHVSCISLLQVVAHRCSLPYVSFVRETDGHGDSMYGIELDLPPLFAGEVPRRLFFWSALGIEPSNPYEAAVLQSLKFLEAVYGFHIIDYNYTELCPYRRLGPQLFAVANRGAHLARCVLTESEYGSPCSAQLLSAAENLLEHINSITNPR